MAHKQLLHLHPDFQRLIEEVAGEINILPRMVEKDYWIMHCLHFLQKARYKFQMKGGTTLSKGYGLIHRFSEDIDIHMAPPEGLKISSRRHAINNSQRMERKEHFDRLATKIQIPGMSVIRDCNSDDEECYEHGGIRLIYPSAYGDNDDVLKRGVLLEVGFEHVSPIKKITFKSWAYDAAIDGGLNVYKNCAVDVWCYNPEYTLVEKIDAVTKKYWQYKNQGKDPINYIRHYYDIHCLLNDEAIYKFTLGAQFRDLLRRKVPRSKCITQLATNEALLLPNLSDFKVFEKQYKKRDRMYYHGQPPFIDVLTTIRNWASNLPVNADQS